MSNETIDATLAQRGSKYGEFRLHAAITQVLKSAMRGTLFEDLQNPAFVRDVQDSQELLKEKWKSLRPDAKESLEMVQHKIGRILNGDPDYDDSWVDQAGYATLLVNRIRADEAKAAAKPVEPSRDDLARAVWAPSSGPIQSSPFDQTR